MIKITILSIIFILSFTLYGQKGKYSSNLSSCTGAINIFENGHFNLQFTSKKDIDFISSYPLLTSIGKENQIWCSYIASTTGVLNFKANVDNDFLQMVIFTQEVDDICGEIQKGIAEIKRVHISKEFKEVGLNNAVSNGTMYSLKMRQGEKIHVLFSTAEEKKTRFNLTGILFLK